MRARNMISNSTKLFAITFLIPVLWVAHVAAANAETHEVAYAQALERLQAAPERILKEMNRIRSGEVAHFDYLQHAHIELVRDARAVRFPPSSMEQSRRETVKIQADRVLQFAMDLELTIADFLRGQALLNGALSSTIDIAEIANSGLDSETQEKLLALNNAASAFRALAGEDTRGALMQAFEAVANSQLTGRFKEELAVQKEVIDTNEGLIERAMNSLGAAHLDRAIAQLIQLYDGAGPQLGNR